MMEKKNRLSNIELLRILSMFMVLVVHANFYALGEPSTADVHENALASLSRFSFQAFAAVCVNVFILISGYFGIHANWKGLAKFIFQCLFFSVGIFAVCLALGIAEFNVENIAGCFLLTPANLWFVKSYALLYILSPILNKFVESASQRLFATTLLVFYGFQVIFGWLFPNSMLELGNGHSTLSFVGLYLLARYIRTYPTKFAALKRENHLEIYLLISVVLAFSAFIIAYFGIPYFGGLIYDYSNPLVIISSLSLLLFFSKMEFKSKVINRISMSCFAVYLLHCNLNLLDYFKMANQYLFGRTDGITVVLTIFAFLVLVYLSAILLDQIRLLLWNGIARIFK